MTLPNGSIEYLDVSIAPLGSQAVTGVLLSFAQVTRYRQLRDDLERSQCELELAYEELQSTVGELETTNEELHSTNEELETMNEELHSTNEELETMNEELQSTNEEFETINGELRERTIELDHLSSFLQAILASLDVGVIVLSENMAVRAWNREAAEQWGVRADEAVGQHIMNLDIGLPMNQLLAAVRSSVGGQTAEPQHHVVEAVNRRGRRVECGVTITPLTLDGEPATGAILLVETHPTSLVDGDSSS
jgi:two-component system CheB/CheR fusion protein